ncbi:MAG TPA: hypothetical protein DDX47_05465 [Candidatus Jacksonbacteria bacterium]|nr:MAG: hypothetical protein UW45_C0020G0018 [Parcubacteria group bacterium GW2011_GWC2_44_22]HBH46780.1 hypothetical protein [Candidatus Jacksonbacteria bacterium]
MKRSPVFLFRTTKSVAAASASREEVYLDHGDQAKACLPNLFAGHNDQSESRLRENKICHPDRARRIGG